MAPTGLEAKAQPHPKPKGGMWFLAAILCMQLTLHPRSGKQWRSADPPLERHRSTKRLRKPKRQLLRFSEVEQLRHSAIGLRRTKNF